MAKQQPRGVSPGILHEIEDAEASPAFFTCTSGELLRGQVHTVIAGFASAGVDTEVGLQQSSAAVPPASGGEETVLATSFRYKAAARKGRWKVEALFQDGSEGEPWHVGFVCHHVDVDGVEVLRRAAEAGLGGNGRFADLDIVFIDRYDWSSSHSPGCEVIVQAVEEKEVDAEEEDFDDEQYYRSLLQGRFLLIDAQGFPDLIRVLKDGERIERRNYLLRSKNFCRSGSSSSDSKSSGDEKPLSNCGNFGTHLVVADSEYDMGWMAFQNGELVGFVYDGAYSGLEGDRLRIWSRHSDHD